jgi:hypothetical protein
VCLIHVLLLERPYPTKNPRTKQRLAPEAMSAFSFQKAILWFKNAAGIFEGV